MVLSSGHPLVRLSRTLFGWVAPDWTGFERRYRTSGINMVSKNYLSLTFFVTTVTFIAAVGGIATVQGTLNPGLMVYLAPFGQYVLFPSLIISFVASYLTVFFYLVSYYYGKKTSGSKIIRYSILFFVIALPIGLFAHSFTLYRDLVLEFFLGIAAPSLIGAAVASGGAFGIMMYYPSYKAGNEKRSIEKNLVFTIGFAAILAASGQGLERIIERVAKITDDSATKRVFSRVIRNLKVFGQDIKTATTEARKHTSSYSITKILSNMVQASQKGGELQSYLNFETKEQFFHQRERLEKTMSNLVYIGEIYVALFVVGPLVLILMLALLSSLGGAAGGLSPVTQINLLVFIGIPLLGAVFLIVLDLFAGGVGQ